MGKVQRYTGFDGGNGRKDGNSEYGGGDGSPLRYGDGSSIPLEDLSGSGRVRDRARLMRTAGADDYDPAAVTPEALEIRGDVQQEALRAQKERLDARTNGYASEPERYVGEPGSAGGSESAS